MVFYAINNMKGNKQLVKSEQPHNSLIAAWLARRHIINIIKITLFIFYFVAVDPQTINIVQHRVFFRKKKFSASNAKPIMKYNISNQFLPVF